MSESSATQQELTPGQKDYVSRSNDFMSKAKGEGLFRVQRIRDLVTASLPVTHGAVTTVMNAYRADNDARFE
ncbi:hypothetical protein L915_14632, partial [Phytophthora nicotianae]